ncbi:MAG: glycoside hydrolase family 97 protein [Bacteroidales bacterium]|jgi:hypothetical protein|nr:glycoside hydrolase family 97 protein [Bacteroidales bacterium]
MKKLSILLAGLILAACGTQVVSSSQEDAQMIQSPDGQLQLKVAVVNGVPTYSLKRGETEVIRPSRLGVELRGPRYKETFEEKATKAYGAPESLYDGFTLEKAERSSFDETWETVWGEEAKIRNHYNELAVTLKKDTGRYMIVRFRVFDDGLGFRYEFPEQEGLTYFVIKDELTEFAMAGDHKAWWIPGDYDTEEYAYNTTRLSGIGNWYNQNKLPGNASQQMFSKTGVQMSIQMKTDDGLYINLHEAAVENYPVAGLNLDPTTMTFRTWLTPDAEGWKAHMQTPCHTPWRSIMVVDSAEKALASRIILNLNEPCALEDVSWIHPVKYMGVWWEMIAGGKSWAYTNEFPAVRLGVTDFAKAQPNGTHSANNENVRRYIDYAAANGFDAILVEGWNEGWEDWFGEQKDFVFDFMTPYPDFDLPALNKYAHEKGIRIIMHHETSSAASNYERWMKPAYELMQKYGYDAVKSGYVGDIIPYGETHYGQTMVNHYNYAIREAAKYHIMVNAHEAARPTGLCRTYPNHIGNESAMGTEFKENVPPEHVTILPFTRLQGGPMDFTPGIFEPDISTFNEHSDEQIHTTLAKQLGIYVTFYSPLQMAADYPEHYDRFKDAFQFIKDVAVDWEESRYLLAEPGDVIVTARKPRLSSLNASARSLAKLPDGKKDVVSGAAKFVYALPENATAKDLAKARPHDVWYVGGVTDENAREVTVKLDFLTPGLEYEATLYADAPDADCETNRQAYTITRSTVTSADSMTVKMARGGGFALSLREK